MSDGRGNYEFDAESDDADSSGGDSFGTDDSFEEYRTVNPYQFEPYEEEIAGGIAGGIAGVGDENGYRVPPAGPPDPEPAYLESTDWYYIYIAFIVCCISVVSNC
jgi:hypothetical protein